MTILDDFAHYTAVFLLERKSEVKEHLQRYVEEAESYHNKRVSKLRCDNGGEFVNNEIKNWCKNKAIIIDQTIPHTPQLNGKAERLNRTIMVKARALIFDSKLEKVFWGEAVRVATYLLNRSPSDSCLENKTPFKNWSGKKPDLSRLQMLGSEAYAKSLGYLKNLDSRSNKYIFVGYAPNGFRLYDEEKQKSHYIARCDF